MNVDIGITEKNRHAIVGMLQALLSDECLLYTKTRNFHWNVTGPQFSELHRLFEGQYEALDATIDAVAERVRALGVHALGSMEEYLKKGRLKERVGRPPTAMDMLAELLSNHEALVKHLRFDVAACASKHGDAGTSDFLTGLMEQHEKAAWMLRSFVDAAPAE